MNETKARHNAKMIQEILDFEGAFHYGCVCGFLLFAFGVIIGMFIGPHIDITK